MRVEYSPIELLLKSYNKLEEGGLVGKIKTKKINDNYTIIGGLAYPYTTLTKADIAVKINNEGKFCGADFVVDEEACLFNPCTVKSQSRTGSAIAPFVLTDSLTYVTSDLGDRAKEPVKPADNADKKEQAAYKTAYNLYKDTKKKNKEGFALYKAFLVDWLTAVERPYSKAMIKYLNEGKLVSDLINAGLFKADEDGHIVLSDKPKSNSATLLSKLSVKWIYVDENGYFTDIGRDKDLLSTYEKYYDEWVLKNDKKASMVVDILTGEKSLKGATVPKLDYMKDCKLIANGADTNWKGRFVDEDETRGLSFNTISKVFNLLAYLGTFHRVKLFTGSDELDFALIWNSKGKEVPRFDDFLSGILGTEETEKEPVDTEEEYRDKLRQALNGYAQKFDVDEDISIVMLGSIGGKGHGAFIYSTTGNAKEYFEKLYKWNESCNWYAKTFTKQEDGSTLVGRKVFTPTIRDILRLTCGYYSGDSIVLDDPIAGVVYRDMLPVITDSRPFSKAFIRQMSKKVSRPNSYKNYDWDKDMQVACACIRKYYNDVAGKEVIPMKLNEVQNPSRSMIWGMLWAMVKYTEYSADKTKKAKAEELMADFAQHPARNWSTVYAGSFNYSLNKIKSEYKRMLITKRIQELVQMFASVEDYTSNKVLEPDWVLGYNLQLNACFESKDVADNDEAETVADNAVVE